MNKIFLYTVVLLALGGALSYAHHRIYQSGYQARVADETKAKEKQLAHDNQAVDQLNKQSAQAQVVYRDRIKLIETLVPAGTCRLPQPIADQLRDASQPVP